MYCILVQDVVLSLGELRDAAVNCCRYRLLQWHIFQLFHSWNIYKNNLSIVITQQSVTLAPL